MATVSKNFKTEHHVLDADKFQLWVQSLPPLAKPGYAPDQDISH